MNFNRVIIAGRVTAQPELRSTPGGQSVCSFSVATNRQWTDKQKQKQEEVEFHNVVAWGRTAEIASQFLGKGALVLVEGRLRTRSYTDKDGNTRRVTEIVADSVQLPPKGEAVAKAVPKHEVKPSHEEIPTIFLEDEDSSKSFGEPPF